MLVKPGETPPQLTSVPVPVVRPLLTYVLIGLLAVIWLIDEISGRELTVLGANASRLISLGEYWRLLTASFLHADISHLLFNCYSLYSLGTQAEALFGRRRFLVIYLLTGLSGAVLSYALTNGNSLGASTAIYGIAGMLAAYFYKHRAIMGSVSKNVLMNIGGVVLVGIFISIAPGSRIDLWGHMGGLLGGLLLGWFLTPTYEQTDPLVHALGSALPPGQRPELANQYITDTNSLAKQAFVLAVFFVVVLALALGLSLIRQPG